MSHSFDARVSDTLRRAGWRETRGLNNDGQRTFHRDRHALTVTQLDGTLRTHPWCYAAMIEALRRGAIGWTIYEARCESRGTLSLTFTPEWPDAVSALGFVSADGASKKAAST